MIYLALKNGGYELRICWLASKMSGALNNWTKAPRGCWRTSTFNAQRQDVQLSVPLENSDLHEKTGIMLFDCSLS